MTLTIRRIFFAVGLAVLGDGWTMRADRARAGCPDHPTGDNPRYERSVGTYDVPDVTLVNQRGEQVALRSILTPKTPIALNFVFTTCRTVCPVMTATFARMRSELGDDGEGLRMISISIDPDHDTPGVLDEYAQRFGGGAEWQFLTGESASVLRVLKAFDAYAGAKTNHQPLTYLHGSGRADWVRIKGFPSAAELANEYRRLRTE